MQRQLGGTPHNSPAQHFSPQESSAEKAGLGNSIPVGMELDYAARPVPSIQLVGIDGFALNARNRISEREEREVGLLGIWALFALAVTIVAARAYSSARRALAAKLAHEFAYILDAIDQLSAAGDDIVILNGSQLPQRGSLLPVAPATPTATWPLLLGSRRAAIVTSFLQAAHALDGMDQRGPELLPRRFGPSQHRLRGRRPAGYDAWRPSAFEPA